MRFLALLFFLILAATALLIVVNAIAFVVRPEWAVEQPWSLLNRDRLRVQREFFGTPEPSSGTVRVTGVVLLAAISFVLNRLATAGEPPPTTGMAVTLWTLWLNFLVVSVAFKGFVWAVEPQFLLSRFPSLDEGFPVTRSGRTFKRISGALILFIVAIFFWL